MASGDIQALIIDGDSTRRSLLRTALDQSSIAVVGEACDLETALALQDQPDAVIVGFDLPDERNLITQVQSAYPKALIIELSKMKTGERRIKNKRKKRQAS